MPEKHPATQRCNSCGRTLPFTTVYFGRHKGHGRWDMESECKTCMAHKDRRKRALEKPQTFVAPKLPGEIDKRYRAMLEFTADGFEAFFNEFATPHKLPAHAKRWVKAAIENKRLLLNVPPRHAKTTIMAEWFPIWLFARDRNTQVLIVSKTTTLGQKLSRKIAHHLEFDSRLNTAFGRFRPESGNAPWRVGQGELQIAGKDLSEASGDLSLQIRGALQQVLGMEADFIIADDVTDRRIAKSEAQRLDEDEWFHGEVMSRLSPDGKSLCIGQRVHGDDLYGRLAQEEDEFGNSVWHRELTPAVSDWQDGIVLWPGVWSFEHLKETRNSIGSALFETMYQQNPASAGEFIKRWWIDGNGEAETPGCLDYNRVIGEGWKLDINQYIPVTRVLSVDPSPTRYAGLVVMDIPFFPQSKEFWCAIVDIYRLPPGHGQKGMLDAIEELMVKYRPSVLVFEENSFKNIREDPMWNRLVPMFRRVIGHNTGRNKQDDLLGVWSLAADYEAGRVRFPYGDVQSREISELLISEALAYPNGQTDDVLMASWFPKPNFKQLIPLDSLPTRFNRLMGSSQVGWNNPTRR